MAGVNGQLAREYLEGLGYVTRPAKNYQVIARAKAPHEEADWLGWNPAWLPGVPRPRAGLGEAAELARVPGVVVAVRGWHTERFSSERLEGAPEVWRFAEEASMRASRAALGV
ncbi:MAG: hypothetical protein IK066_00525, partial [Kiritimatiellae bacterium]|nr:hypothetical protein [Kiritimatiellia bacterium]